MAANRLSSSAVELRAVRPAGTGKTRQRRQPRARAASVIVTRLYRAIEGVQLSRSILASGGFSKTSASSRAAPPRSQHC